jgi:hypothetical protein
MLVDLFSIPETTTLFYTNDVKVLIDILVRQLSDLSAGDVVSLRYKCMNFLIYKTFRDSSENGISNCAAESCATPTTPNINTAL